MMLKDSVRSSAIRRDALEVMKQRDEGPSPGGDFHVPFWSAAKNHAAGKVDLSTAVEEQIARNAQRKRLYPLLRDGFLAWWQEKRRWINEEISELPKTIKSSFGFSDIDGRVKVENLLSLQIGEDRYRYIYPYFSDKPVLTPQGARLGLWLMSKALPEYNVEDMRIIDVIRGQTFSIDRYPFEGNEEQEFTLVYRRILREWRTHFR